jgi:RNA polymerase sigma factor (sigma-70 family)
VHLPRNLHVLRQLELRGVAVHSGGELSPEGLETGLMALFRDTRGELAFQELYEASRAGLLQWIVQVSHGRVQAADPLELLQDTFVNIYRYAAGFRDESAHSFRVWSRTIAGNLIRRRRREAASRRLRSLPEGPFEPADARSGPHESIVAEEDRRLAARAWMLLLQQYALAYAQLSEREQRALDLIEVRGWSYAETAAVLRVGSSNMKMILFRARRRIRKSIAIAFDRRAERRRIAG